MGRIGKPVRIRRGTATVTGERTTTAIPFGGEGVGSDDPEVRRPASRRSAAPPSELRGRVRTRLPEAASPRRHPPAGFRPFIPPG